MTRKIKKPVKAKAAPKAAGGGKVFTTSELAKEMNTPSKTLRARIRRQIKAGEERWAKLMLPSQEEGQLSHTFKDNATTRKAIAEILA